MAYNPAEDKFHDDMIANGYMFKAMRRPSTLIIDEGIQMRVGFDQSKVAEYTELWKQGVIFPPLDIFADVKGDKKDRVADGFHRLLAAIAANIERVPCNIYQGDRRAAILHACKANTKHGWRATALDRRKAVITLLLDNEWKKESNVWIAEQCGSDERTVRRIQAELAADLPAQASQSGISIFGIAEDGTKSTNEINAGEKPTPESEIRIVKRGGKEFPMKVNNIGAKQKEQASESIRGTIPSTTAQQSPATLATDDSIKESLRCDACDEVFPLKTLKVFDEFMYCEGCAFAAERLRKPAPPKEEKTFDTSPTQGLAEARRETRGQPTIQPSGHDSWCTSPEHVELIHRFAGGPIALDPCSNPHATTTPLLKFYKEHDGLSKDWAQELEARRLRGLVYVNPPYDTDTLEKVATHCVTQHSKGLEILSLVPCKMDQEWWQSTVFETASAICFVKGRIKFWEEGAPKAGAPMPCAFVYWGPRADFFEVVFSAVGRVLSLELLREAKTIKQTKPTLSLVKGDDE